MSRSAPSGTRRIAGGSKRFFNRGAKHAGSEHDYKVPAFKKQRLQPYDRDLKGFRYHDALDHVLEVRDERK